MPNVYEFLLAQGATPEDIRQLMTVMQQQQTAPLIRRAMPGMRGDLATRPPARSQPSGIYAPRPVPQRRKI